ncbi:adenylate/guanylate cyclase domain-containing protein [Sulfurisoma sediminicola]|uniref:Class 3 adenylate cyclase n=1 Tax=Sulfurisoma sediminicola TaxID=1381557 RepID=A0A497XBP9_9PROT|nr:adenylate/guanylate cyclase domain-containing protein [Sulfurisoma sediminicola]RLJ63753.1 class 3 adenylate cyclase [Sulfurisoma sediminicola]
MSRIPDPPINDTFIERLRSAGIEASDPFELRLNKALLMLATGLISVTSMLWLTIYWVLGPQLSSTLPFVFQLLLVANMLLYIGTRNFNFFRITQTALFLFMPFVVQWTIGNFITASGISLWGLLAPVGAVLFFGVGESVAWFFAWCFMIALSGMFDFLLADAASATLAVPVRTSVVFFALNFIAVSTIVYSLLHYSIQEKQKIQAKFDDAHRLLEIEQQRAERLLLNILPEPVATRLKNSDQTIADGYADVSVMFADIVNFTQVAANMAPNQVFAMLNRIFSAFDDLAGQHGLEKIKTIGDAYMVAGGLNDDAADYTAAIGDMAISMRELLHRDFMVNQAHLEIRIGIGTGPVVAGVVGKKKFIYDLWGDTVNIASRITAEGVPGMIQCDTVTYHRLQHLFDFHEPQTIYLKGKGNMTVYRLIGRKLDAATEAETETGA